MNTKRAIVAAAFVVAVVLRLVIPGGGVVWSHTPKDVAHVFVGMLIGAALALKDKEYCLMAAALTVLEFVLVIAKR